MGLTGASEFEAELAEKVSPRAFYHHLPSNVACALKIYDLSSVGASSFFSNRPRTGAELVSTALYNARASISADRASQIPVPVARRDNSSGCSGVEEGLPTISDLIEERDAGSEKSVAMTGDAIVVFTKDDKRYLPSIRKMLHEDRAKGIAPYTDDELGRGNCRIFGSHPLPEDRRRAYGTAAFRRAIGAYLPWAMMTQLVQESFCIPCFCKRYASRGRELMRNEALVRAHACLETAESLLKDGKPTEKSAEFMDAARQWFTAEKVPEHGPCTCSDSYLSPGRSVIIDAVPSAFDVDAYGQRTVEAIPKEFYDTAERGSRVVRLDFGSHSMSDEEPPALGEADLKMVYYILRYSKPGDDVVVCNNDSDVLYILLLNAHRLVDPKTGHFTRRLFFDQNHSRLAKTRLHRRIVFVNQLYSDMEVFARRHWSLVKTGPVPHALSAAAVFSAVALLTKGDYTIGLPKVTPKKRFEVLENDSAMRAMTNVFGHVEVKAIEGEHLGSNPTLVAISVSNEFAMRFSLECIVRTMPVAVRSKLQERGHDTALEYQNVAAAVASVNGDYEASAARNPKKRRSCIELPTRAEILGRWARISWSLTYMGNAPIGVGPFPSPTIRDGEGRSVWGWNVARAKHTAGTGRERILLEPKWIEVAMDVGHNADPGPFVPILDNQTLCPGKPVIHYVLGEYEARASAGSRVYAFEVLPSVMLVGGEEV